MKDSAYWNIFISGQKQILEVIYTKYYDHLLNYGLKLYPDMDFVKDCIQDLFVKLYSSKNIKPTEHVRSYLLKSIRNIIIDKLNKDKLQITDKDALFHLIVDEDELEKKLGANDEELLLLKKLLQAYNQLSENQKQIIYFRYIQELPHKEIAEILDINEQSSMNLASRALTKLRRELQNKNKQAIISSEDLRKSLTLLFMLTNKAIYSVKNQDLHPAWSAESSSL
ncbi:RNA polymerase sigma factor [Sunxiuqinia elliptica]|uniref:RNA polymerase sigma-70 factor, ECF subfamily n=1 Tax=Sunxiuqinia elliptica TaxID=655355 RepID=A0A1I2IGZ6_9BACT|nr:sigma-70 family RNA polymerase sigma factor [Sunxiuqinia elliptica]SFF41672.1 RNA polymerase sigma-70 factor, ECF subfamily [Sunxiuqinia elliptica]